MSFDSSRSRRWFLMGISGAAALSAQPAWTPLFDGKTLGQWKDTEYSGRGVVRVANEAIVLEAGSPLTGVTWKGDFPTSGYEIRYEAMRVKGGDFFASLTVPVGDSHGTWVLGGWGGDIVGFSSIDGWDAADNETRSYFNFETGRWYRLRLQVTSERIQAWIDDQRVVNVEIGGRKISMRMGDIGLSVPLGLASYNTTGQVRKIEYRLLRSPSGDRGDD
jgi:hypothetical protein